MHQPHRLLFGTSRAMRRILDQCERYAAIRNPVLILGEPGTGKTLLAEHLHRLSGRPGRLVKESAPHVPEHLEISHLCGHARGTFTGAERDRPGLIEAAHRGTFFLDELGDASVRVQQILRQLLEDGSIRRVGEDRDRPVDVRFIAATNADLEGMVRSGAFRRDLLDRFGFLKIRMPRLADRRDEILPLLDFFFQRETKALGLSERPVLSPAVRACLTAAPWTGNIRELEALSVYLIVHAEPGRPIELVDLPAEFLASMGDVLQRAHEDSRAALRARDALERADGNKSAAARLLGISRTQFYRLLADLRALGEGGGV
ncbi:MAG: sigma 54-interacting transcriptional regulator [Gemmatimonadales bacterium]